jgi:type VI secretion system protein ImpH
MATTSRSQDLALNRNILGDALRTHPGRFQFFQMVRVLERLHPDAVPVGRFGPPHREAVRFSVHNSLAFPPSQVHALKWNEGEPPVVVVNFIGLTGPMGVLPYAYTELLRDRNRAKDRGLSEFFDLFNHRVISLFYQAWEKYRFFVAYERDQQDRFSRYLMSFIGLGTRGLEQQQPEIRDQSLLFFSGLLSLQTRSAAALEQLVSDYFGVKAEVEQFVGAWHSVAPGDQCCFEAGHEYSEQLGLGAVAGDEVWTHDSRVRLKLGPMPIAKYLDFLPPGKAYHPLETILRFFTNYEFEYEVQLVLEKRDVPVCELGKEEQAMPFLGWTTWMKSGDGFGRNPADTILLLQ